MRRWFQKIVNAAVRDRCYNNLIDIVQAQG
jgi:hypothetical protein